MGAVHWWALAGLAWFFAGFWLFVRSHAEAQRAAEDRYLIRRQLEMLCEAIELSKYGAQEEAHQMIDEAVRLKPLWDVRQV